jgi:phosphate transport system permease protein
VSASASRQYEPAWATPCCRFGDGSVNAVVNGGGTLYARAAVVATPGALHGRRFLPNLGDRLFRLVLLVISVGVIALLFAITWKIIDGARLAYDEFGLRFITNRNWDPVTNSFGALDLIYGTAVTSFFALLFAVPLSIAIALFLTELAPQAVRDVVGALIEMLAAIPSVVLGLWGILVLGPFIHDTLGPFVQKLFGWLPLFKGDPQASSVFTASVILTIMVVPIIASITRELLSNVPGELKDGALALGTTRWEMLRGVVLPYVRGGIVAAVVLGFGRAIGEAIAVTQVIGGQLGIHASLFEPGDTLASRIAAQYQGASSNVQVSALVYLAAILLVISLVINIGAQLIVGRFEQAKTGGS